MIRFPKLKKLMDTLSEKLKMIKGFNNIDVEKLFLPMGEKQNWTTSNALFLPLGHGRNVRLQMPGQLEISKLNLRAL